MDLINLPFQPIRGTLYSSRELMAGFDAANPDSVADTTDFRTYRYFVVNGRAMASNALANMLESLHDGSIVQAMWQMLKGRKRIAAVMGGHREVRGSVAYRIVAEISRELTRKGFLMASGGGPGAMEATHLGALVANQPDRALDAALGSLSTQPTLPDSRNVVRDDGSVDPEVLRGLHAWVLPAHELMTNPANTGTSLAVPTWYYGHEPFTPLASHVAKYFQNSIREDVLLALASQGIVFAPGKAGTLQEVFQDAAQNYYHGPEEPFSPMVFLDLDGYWTTHLPVRDLLSALFTKNEKGAEYHKKVLFTDDPSKVIQFLIDEAPSPSQFSTRLKALGLSEG